MGWRPRLGRIALGLGIGVSLGLSAPAGNAEAAESSAQRLHRKGVHCMEEIERTKCAIEHFEALLAENTRDRALITDAVLRLVKLYRVEGLDEPLRVVLRQFWEAGGRRQRTGHLPYSAQFLPDDLDMVGHVDIQLALAAPLADRLPPEVVEMMTTCDDVRRSALGDVMFVRRAQRRAKAKSMTTEAAIQEIAEEEAAQRERYKKRQAEREVKTGTPEEPPVFAHSLCEAARALGSDSTETWSRVAFAMSHMDTRRSVAIAMIPGLAPQIEEAVRSGRLTPNGDRRWILADHSYDDAPVEVASFDLDELTIAPTKLMPTIAATIAKGRPTMHREVAKLVSSTPKDLAFFAVATGAALRKLGLGEQSGGRKRLLEALLPRPDGLQIAGAAHDYLGVFLRMPTDNPVKVQLLIELATRMLAAEEDEETAEMMRNLDLAQASDRRALLISYVVSPTQIEDMLLD